MVSGKVKNRKTLSTKASQKSPLRPTNKPAKGQLSRDYFLKKGDVIEIVAPASACPAEVIAKGVAWIEKNGFIARVPQDLLKPDLYLANTDEYRLNHLKKALHAKDSKAIWCVRGGYGSSRLIPDLLKFKKQKEKLFIGLSDITTLHLFLVQNWGWRVLHASLLDRLAENKLSQENEQELLQVITGEKSEMEFDRLEPLNEKAMKKGKIEGRLLGGNLTVLSANIGTLNDLKAKNYILFLEDLGERGYRIDRMLQQIKQSKGFAQCKAIVLGEFMGGDEPNKENHVMIALKKFSSEIKIPVFAGVPCGHGVIQRPLFFNTQATLFCGGISQLKVYNK